MRGNQVIAYWALQGNLFWPQRKPLTWTSLPLRHQNLSIETDLHAANGKRVKALDIFAYALAFFKEQALKVSHSVCQHCHTSRRWTDHAS